MNLTPVIKFREVDSNGDPLAGGLLYSYQAGTTTPQATYTDQGGGTANANPVVLDASGRADVWLDPTLSYKFVLKDSGGSTIWTVDDVVGILTADAVATASIQDSAITTAKIADDAVTADKLRDDASIDANRAVTTNHIRDGAVTIAKLSSAALLPGFYNIGLQAATTSNSNDSIKITGATAALSSTNTGKVVLPSSTAGYVTVFTISADVTIDMTGAHAGLDGLGDFTDLQWSVYGLNNNGALAWGISTNTSRKVWTTSEDTTSPASMVSSEYILVNSALAADAPCMILGYYKANFDDSAGAEENLWSIQTGDGDIVLGVPDKLSDSFFAHTGNGYGSTDTKIRRISGNVVQNTDRGILRYTDTAANGAVFTALRPCNVTGTWNDISTTNGEAMGFSLNSNQLTTNLTSINAANRLSRGNSVAATSLDGGSTSFSKQLACGDKIRLHGQGNMTTSSDQMSLTMTAIEI